jgi:hypothetical protein
MTTLLHSIATGMARDDEGYEGISRCPRQRVVVIFECRLSLMLAGLPAALEHISKDEGEASAIMSSLE